MRQVYSTIHVTLDISKATTDTQAPRAERTSVQEIYVIIFDYAARFRCIKRVVGNVKSSPDSCAR